MNKDDIRFKLRESLVGISEEKEEKESDKEKKAKKTGKKDYSDVQLAMDKSKDPTAPSQVGVMKKMGISDDESGVNRSLFGKKLHQEKNEEGVYYQFDDDELSRIRGILAGRT